MKKGWIVVVVALACGALVWGLLRWLAAPSAALSAAPSAAGWPAPEAAISAPGVAIPAGFGTHRIFVDPGHGAEGNTGNRSAFCRDEQDFTMGLATQLAIELEATGHFEVKTSRSPDTLVPYRARVSTAEQWGAEAFVSIHSDVRGKTEQWAPDAGLACLRSRAAPGFSVLWSDQGAPDLLNRRLSLARSLAAQLERMGLTAYDGREYQGLYDGDGRQPGVFVDRHAPKERIFVLHKPTMPSVIVETHNALDDREALRWEEPEVRRAFGAAVTTALVELLARSSPADQG
ncbi:MAG: N-acetylmuramoyl-L-alanine amidase [Deltaproteobacteria bacterium]|nr:N-acetylmuramoyl-L-alanine amidase [Deltaproteobacteria bacterium]